MGERLEDLARTLAAHLETEGAMAQTLTVDPRVTLRPDSSLAPTLHTTHGTSIPEAEAALHEWSAPVEPLELRTTLGEGGMGLVHMGYQQTLRRTVAVKAIKKDLLSPKTVKKLLSEARVTGSLEHPNVVPVHDIATGADGAPLIVLKRIEGVEWSRLIARPEELRERHGAEDALEWHLRVLVQVANAIAFAHDRGVLHRDLKPENVMIGSFGEVYVLDWGLAVRLPNARPGTNTDLPTADEIAQVAGTPSYMAPEMLGGSPSRLSERTDVYLLGAMLHEILTGKPPHLGVRLIEVLQSVARSEPQFPDTVPDELAAIARRAMSRDPNARFATALELRDAVSAYLRHRSSIELARQAELRETELEALLAGENRSTDDPKVAALFAESRFGFRQALADWPMNERAREGQERVILRMARHALASDDPRGASRLLAELAAAPADLRQSVDAAVAVERAGKDELRRLKDQLEPAVGRRIRIGLSAFVGAIWIIGPVASQLIGGDYQTSAVDLAVPPLVLLAIVCAVFYRFRDIVRRTAVNRRLSGAAVVTMIAEASVHAGGALGGLEPEQTHTVALLLFGVVTAMMALVLAKELFLPALGYLLAFFVAAYVPGSGVYAQSAANLVFTITAIWAWERSRNPLAHLG